MGSKGQITLFIVVGVAILVVVGISLYLTSSSADKEAERQDRLNTGIDEQMDTFDNYVQGCIEDVFNEGLERIAFRGGFDEIALEDQIKDTRYWYNLGVDMTPSLNRIKTNLQDYVDSHILSECTDHSLFRSWGYEIESGQPATQLMIADSYIFLDVDYPITVKRDDYVKQFSKFKVNRAARLKKMYEVADFINKQAETLDRYSPPKNLDFQVSYDNFYEGLIVTLREKEGSTYDRNFRLRFGIGIPLSYEPVVLDMGDGVSDDLTIPSSDHGLFLTIPKGTRAFINGTEVFSVNITVNPPENITSPEKVLTEMYFNIQPEGVTFDHNLTLAMQYQDDEDNETSGIGAPLPVRVDEENQTIEFDV